ncbi:MAG TPA: MarR family transcriptional regulator [Candidatus Desulfaltia sp.]|jgi:DNA-binding MarR family transcriptional regulator|nr:MarR family transcriptional regulator [Candidatus Desulfaltia sp.]
MSETWDKVLKDVSPTTSQFKVLVYLAFRGPSQPSDISSETGIAPGTVRPALRTLLDKGYVAQQEDGSYRSLVPFTDVVSHLYAVQK